MFQAELDVVPDCPFFPAVKIDHFKKYADSAVLSNELFNFRNEALVALMHQFATDLHFQHSSRILLFEHN
jgi:hypothetical protein